MPAIPCLSLLLSVSHGFCLWSENGSVLLQEGTLTPKEAGVGMLTLTGWSASLGMLSLIAVVVAGGVWGYWKYKGYDKMTAYTQVSKAERSASSSREG